jgi:hypothetical protein
MIAIAVYDTEKVASFLQSIRAPYQAEIAAAKSIGQKSDLVCHDCLNNSVFNRPEAASGVEVFYQPPRFGRKNVRGQHSGWACWQIKPVKTLSAKSN